MAGFVSFTDTILSEYCQILKVCLLVSIIGKVRSTSLLAIKRVKSTSIVAVGALASCASEVGVGLRAGSISFAESSIWRKCPFLPTLRTNLAQKLSFLSWARKKVGAGRKKHGSDYKPSLIQASKKMKRSHGKSYGLD
jgi:hypothetical protein